MDILQMSGSYRKWIRRLHRRKFREEKGVFIAEGFNALEAAIETTCHPILEVVADEDHLESIVDILPEENIGVTSSLCIAQMPHGFPLKLEGFSRLKKVR